MSNKLTCLRPYKPPGQTEAFARCRVCPNCNNHRRMEWANRLKLENHGLNYRPLFVTCTYTPKHLPQNYSECLKVCQKWLKRLRRRNITIRYFMCTERGEKFGRLHQHLLIWSPELARLPIIESWKILYDTWGQGRLQSEPIRHAGGFNYVSKYITKNFGDSENGEWSRKEGKWINPGRLYTWSNKPVIGNSGLERWKYLSKIMAENTGHLPPNWLTMHIFQKPCQVYIPSDQYKKHVKDLGFSLNPTEEAKTNHIKPIDISEKDALYYLKVAGDREYAQKI